MALALQGLPASLAGLTEVTSLHMVVVEFRGFSACGTEPGTRHLDGGPERQAGVTVPLTYL